MEMNEKIKALRENLGLTLEDVGNIVGVGKSTVRKWETGDIANMRIDKIDKLARALQTTPAYLMGWSEDERDASSNIEQCHGSLTPAELSLLSAYRRAPQEIRTIVDTALAPYGEKTILSEPSAG